MYGILFLTCADDGIGRFDRSMLSQQSLMELFIFGLDKIRGSRDSLAKVCQRKGIECNADKQVEAFTWMHKRQGGAGTLRFAFLPSSMKMVKMKYNALRGTIELADVPKKMKS